MHEIDPPPVLRRLEKTPSPRTFSPAGGLCFRTELCQTKPVLSEDSNER